MWAVVDKWYAGRYEGFGVLITEDCEEVIARDPVVDSDIPLKAGDRVLIDYLSGAEGAGTIKLVKVQ
ncbi:hypothetical protein F3087_08065 [Nocardia colli]|uniref:Uncharacterized protein n=1 Tax=Nocardia colli TaxID=2545717 RepID=A0A5N0EJ14_9NOCA|nr:hypothetical protein [Nocardia colli]KAA8888946.1 hypothetical protein F3087_08065 [Nocardia colli]